MAAIEGLSRELTIVLIAHRLSAVERWTVLAQA